MKEWFRHHRYALRVALRRLVAQPFSSLANVVVIALSLVLPLVGAAVLSSAQPVIAQLSVDPQVTLFLQRDAGAQSLQSIAQRLRDEHGNVIADVRTVPRDQALRQLQRNPGWSSALSVLPDNPLPDAIVVTLRTDADAAANTDAATQASNLAQQWRQWDHVDTVQLDSDWVRRLQAILDAARFGLAVLGLGVVLVVLATIFNTVRMQALSQREEIGVARLVGATEAFVRRPFLYLGALTGTIASLLAIGAAHAVLGPLNTALGRLAASYDTAFALRLPDAPALLLAVLAVAGLAALSARWSVTRNTRF